MLNNDGKRSLISLSIVLVAALGLRLFHLQDRVLWFDEAGSLLVARAGPAEIIDAVHDDIHSPFYFLILHYWQLLGQSEAVARLLSVLAGVATVAAVWKLGRVLLGRGAGLAGAVFLAICPLHVWYSQEIKMYAVQTLLVTLSFLFMVLALRQQGKTLWIGYCAFTALSLYAQYASVYAIVAQNIFVTLYYWRDRQKIRVWLISQGVVGLLFAPWVPVFLSQARSVLGSSWMGPFEFGRVLAFFSLLSGAYLGDPHPRAISEAITILGLLLPTAILVRAHESRQQGVMLVLWFVVPVVLLMCQSLNYNRFLPRALLYTTPPFALLLGCASCPAGTARPSRKQFAPTGGTAPQPGKKAIRVVGMLAAFAVLTANFYALGNYYFSENPWVKSDLRIAADKLSRELQPGDVVLHLSESSLRPFQCYLGIGAVQGVIDLPVYQPHLFRVIGDGRLPKSSDGYKRIWLVLYPDQFHRDLAETARDWMNRHHHFVKALHESSTVFVGLYDRQDAQLAPAVTR
jgi:hypothetical protein